MKHRIAILVISIAGCDPSFIVEDLAVDSHDIGLATVSGMITLVSPDASGPTLATARFYTDRERAYFIDEVQREVGEDLSVMGDSSVFSIHSGPAQIRLTLGGAICMTIKVEHSDAFTFVDAGCVGMEDGISHPAISTMSMFEMFWHVVHHDRWFQPVP